MKTIKKIYSKANSEGIQEIIQFEKNYRINIRINQILKPKIVNQIKLISNTA